MVYNVSTMHVIEVDRPSNADQDIYPLLIETATSKRAIEVVLNKGDDIFRWTSRMRMRLSKNDPPLILRYRQDKSTSKITCWAETGEEAGRRRKMRGSSK